MNHQVKKSCSSVNTAVDPPVMFRGTTVRTNASVALGHIYSGLLTMSEGFLPPPTNLLIQAFAVFFFKMKKTPMLLSS